jgi:hypothetical protein
MRGGLTFEPLPASRVTEPKKPRRDHAIITEPVGWCGAPGNILPTMKKDQSKTGRDTCGRPDPRPDHFTDVKRALHTYLMRTNPIYSKASTDASARNARRKELME